MNPEIFKSAVIGAVNTYIRLINESDKYDEVGKGIIDNTWRSTITTDGCFHIHLTINGNEETITLLNGEWNDLSVNHLAIEKLQRLAERFETTEDAPINLPGEETTT